MITINSTQYAILEYTGGWFGFLTTSQIMELTKKSGGYVREMTGNLVKSGYLHSFRIEVSKIRSENMYSITPLGIEVLQSHSDIYTAPKMPSSAPLIVRDYWHRANTVWSMLKIWQHLQVNNINIRSLLFYYDKQGSTKTNNLIAKTALFIDKEHGTYIPDAILQTDKALYLIECFNDRDVKRCLSSLAVHAIGISAGVPSKVYKLNVNAKVLSVFVNKVTMDAVIKKMKANTQLTPEMAKLFYFVALVDLKQHGCEGAFTNIYKEPLLFT